MLQYIIPATGLLFTLENILWINIIWNRYHTNVLHGLFVQ